MNTEKDAPDHFDEVLRDTDVKMDVNVLEKTLAELQTEFNFVP